MVESVSDLQAARLLVGGDDGVDGVDDARLGCPANVHLLLHHRRIDSHVHQQVVDVALLPISHRQTHAPHAAGQIR